jgi:L-threonylcarbamoyladenylate synthase
MLPTHYAPRTPLVLIDAAPPHARERLLQEICAALSAGQRVGVLALADDAPELPPEAVVQRVGSFQDPAASAARLFDALRALDASQLDVLFARQLADPHSGLGRALADRLKRAAQRVVVPQ